MGLLDSLLQEKLLYSELSVMEHHEEDSDSAPEDVAFTDAKSDALAHLKTVSEAAKQKKKLRKEQIKKRQENLAEQKQIKKQKLEELESKKLSLDVLDDLKEDVLTEATTGKIVTERVSEPENTRIIFNDEAENEDDENDSESEDFIALKTSQTDFKVVTSTDLKSSSFTSKDVYSFRERMLYGNRVKREPHTNKQRQQEKLNVTGLSRKLTTPSST